MSIPEAILHCRVCVCGFASKNSYFFQNSIYILCIPILYIFKKTNKSILQSL